MGKRSLFLIVLTLFCLVEAITVVPNIKCHKDNLFSGKIKIFCKAGYIMSNPVKIDKLEYRIKESLKDSRLEDVVQL